MTDIALLKEKVNDSGMKITAISEKTGIPRATLYNRFNGIGEFTASEIVALSRVLGLSVKERDQIFLH